MQLIIACTMKNGRAGFFGKLPKGRIQRKAVSLRHRAKVHARDAVRGTALPTGHADSTLAQAQPGVWHNQSLVHFHKHAQTAAARAGAKRIVK
ncbi:hypothetical protein SDC9_130871 [bioreactor metagenome]|uniref:Uncharacterized protein n=1 Tax=bioreactor metagenome TaxID=1076179 RepID=A0A645D598_9ZZZZ